MIINERNLNRFVFPARCTTISAYCHLTAKLTSKHEIKKVMLQYEHEEKTSLYQTYKYLQEKVRFFISCPTPPNNRQALAAIGSFLPYAPTNMVPVCNALSDAIKNNDAGLAFDFLNRLNIEWQNFRDNEISTKTKKPHKTTRK